MALFARLYGLLASSERHQREDYLTEILAEYLREDGVVEAVLDRLLPDREFSMVGCTVQTQRSYSSANGSGHRARPDVVLEIETEDDTSLHVFIENKLQAGETGDQLEDYARQLVELHRDRSPAPVLVYLTERADPREAAKYERHGIQLLHIRWYQLYRILTELEAGSPWLRSALLNFLEAEELNMSRTFRPEDLYALRRSSAVFSLLDEALDGEVVQYADETMGLHVRRSASRSTQVLSKDRYIQEMKIDDEGYRVVVGASWSERDQLTKDQLPIATFILQCKPGHAQLPAVESDMKGIFQRDNGFDEEIYRSPGNYRFIHRYLPMVDILPDNDHVDALEEWWLTGLRELVDAADAGDAPYLNECLVGA